MLLPGTSAGRMNVQLVDTDLLRQHCYVDGQWVTADDGAAIDVNNPATNEQLASVPKLGAKETRSAIEAAARAFQSWRRTTAKQRAHVMRRLHDLMLHHQDDLARLMTAEQGKPLAEAKGEIGSA